jgi:hypothetical protein
VTWIICTLCGGDGSHVNPSIDAHGLSAEDFADDPDFAEAYMRGDYDVSCRRCGGTGKLRADEAERIAERAAEAARDRRTRAAEDGDWESYLSASDERWTS